MPHRMTADPRHRAVACRSPATLRPSMAAVYDAIVGARAVDRSTDKASAVLSDDGGRVGAGGYGWRGRHCHSIVVRVVAFTF